jgi:regulator of protease activity HflC (stomatin/prohibitin superfamily)
MNSKYLKLALMAVAISSIVGCTRIDSGHVGVRTGFGGMVDPNVLHVGWHQTLIGSVQTVQASEITYNMNNLQPMTADKTQLNDMDLTYTYDVDEKDIPEDMVRFKNRNDIAEDGTIMPLGKYVGNVMTTAISNIVGKYKALEANTNRDIIRDEIKKEATRILAEEKMNGVHIRQIFIKNLMIDKRLTDSSMLVITQQNAYAAKVIEVQTAEKEAERLTMLSNNAKNIEYMNAKAMADIAEGVREGKVNTIIVPYDFKGIINANPK